MLCLKCFSEFKGSEEFCGECGEERAFKAQNSTNKPKPIKNKPKADIDTPVLIPRINTKPPEIKPVTLPVYSHHLTRSEADDITGKDIVIQEDCVSIDERAFFRRDDIHSIVLPNGIKTIGKNAFAFCTHLTYINIPASINSIGKDAFENCQQLYVNCEENEYAKKYCDENFIKTKDERPIKKDKKEMSPAYRLNYNIPNTLFTTKEARQLRGSTVVIPEGYTAIDANAFKKRNDIVSITIPSGITEIQSFAFEKCTNLTYVELPETLKYIRSFAFQKCKSLNNVYIPSDVIEIGDYAFDDCSSLNDIGIPESVKKIGKGAFDGCPFYIEPEEDEYEQSIDDVNLDKKERARQNLKWFIFGGLALTAVFWVLIDGLFDMGTPLLAYIPIFFGCASTVNGFRLFWKLLKRLFGGLSLAILIIFFPVTAIGASIAITAAIVVGICITPFVLVRDIYYGIGKVPGIILGVLFTLIAIVGTLIIVYFEYIQG